MATCEADQNMAPRQTTSENSVNIKVTARKMSESILENFRDNLARFQEKRGVSATDYGFFTLVAAILSMLTQSMQSLLSLLMTLLPVSDISLHIVRFSLERMIDIKNSPDSTVALRKTLVFAGQVMMIVYFIVFMCGSILMPVTQLCISVFGITKLLTGVMFM